MLKYFRRTRKEVPPLGGPQNESVENLGQVCKGDKVSGYLG